MIVISSWRVIGTSPMIDVRSAELRRVVRDAFGSQIQFAMPIIENSNETVTTSLIVSVVCCRPRKIDDLEEHAEQRTEHEEHDRDRDRRRPAPVEAQLPVRERAEHADRAVREVEDAGRRVREHESAGRDREDRRQ